jgi:hypothetical protein
VARKGYKGRDEELGAGSTTLRPETPKAVPRIATSTTGGARTEYLVVAAVVVVLASAALWFALTVAP